MTELEKVRDEKTKEYYDLVGQNVWRTDRMTEVADDFFIKELLDASCAMAEYKEHYYRRRDNRRRMAVLKEEIDELTKQITKGLK